MSYLSCLSSLLFESWFHFEWVVHMLVKKCVVGDGNVVLIKLLLIFRISLECFLVDNRLWDLGLIRSVCLSLHEVIIFV